MLGTSLYHIIIKAGNLHNTCHQISITKMGVQLNVLLSEVSVAEWQFTSLPRAPSLGAVQLDMWEVAIGWWLQAPPTPLGTSNIELNGKCL